MEFVLKECVQDSASDYIEDYDFDVFVYNIVNDEVIHRDGNGDKGDSHIDFQKDLFIAYSAFQLEKKK